MCLDSIGIVALPDDRGLVAALVEMAVDAVPGDVQDAVLEPFDRDIAGGEGDVLDLVERLDPADPLALFGPEGIGVGDRARIHLAILGVVDEGALRPVRRHVVNLLGHLPLHSIASPTRKRPQAVLIVTMIMRRRGCPDKAETSATLVGSRALRSAPAGPVRPSLSRFGATQNQRYRANGSHDRYLITVNRGIGTRKGVRYPLNGVSGVTGPRRNQAAASGITGRTGGAGQRRS